MVRAKSAECISSGWPPDSSAWISTAAAFDLALSRGMAHICGLPPSVEDGLVHQELLQLPQGGLFGKIAGHGEEHPGHVVT